MTEQLSLPVWSAQFLFLILFMHAHVFAQQPELIVPTGHSNYVKSVAFSSDGKLMASAGDSIKVWELKTNRELLSIHGHNRYVNSIAFSPNGKYLASGSEDQSIKLWQLSTGKEVRAFTGHKAAIKSIAFSPDGRLLAGGTLIPNDFSDDNIKLWEVESGNLFKTLSDKYLEARSLAFSPDGKSLAGAGGTVTRLWNVETGERIGMFASGDPAFGRVFATAFSPDGSILATSDPLQIRLWDVKTQQLLRILSHHPEVISSIVFSPDGKKLASSSGQFVTALYKDVERKWDVRLWDVGTGNALMAFQRRNPTFSIAFSPDGKLLAMGGGGAGALWTGNGSDLDIFDLEKSKYRKPLKQAPLVRTLAISPDHTMLVSGGDDGTLRLTNAGTAQVLRVLTGHRNAVSQVAFSPNGRLLASGSLDRTIKLWDVKTGKETLNLNSDDLVEAIAFSPDGNLLAGRAYGRQVMLWKVSSGTKRYELNHPPKDAIAGGIFGPITFSPDGKHLASYYGGRFIILWNTENGEFLKLLDSATEATTRSTLSFSFDSRFLAGGFDKQIRIWDIESGKIIHKLNGHQKDTYFLAFSPDGKSLMSMDLMGDLKLWNTKTGTELEHKYFPEWLDIREGYVLFTKINGRRVRITRDGGQIRFIDPLIQKNLVSLMAYDQASWLVATPEGFFDGTPPGWNQIGWRFDNDIFSYGAAELYFSDFFYPGLMEVVLGGKSPQPKKGQELEKIDRRQPKVAIMVNGHSAPIDSETAIQFVSDQRTLRVTIEITDNADEKKQSLHQQTSGAQGMRLFRNGSLVKAWPGDVFKLDRIDNCEQLVPTKQNELRRVRCQASVSIVAGENELTAYAFNSSNVKSNDATVIVKGADSLRRTKTLYVLAIGVGQYENPRYNLNYPVADTQSFSEHIKLRQEQVQQFERVEVVRLTNDQATKRNIFAELKRLAATVQPEDAAIVYFSGHGTAEQNHFYLIPHDLNYMGPRRNLSPKALQTILVHSISDIELEEVFHGIDTGQLLLIIDACNSGQALESEEKRRGPMNSKGLAQLAYEKGMYVLTASQSFELAFESTALRHSYLTYALVEEGLQTKVKEADDNGDGQLLLREWYDYAVQRVPRLRSERLELQTRSRNKALDLVEITRQTQVQTPRVFYRKEADRESWIIAKTQ